MNVTLRPWHKNDRLLLASLANNINIWNNVRDRLPHPYQLHHADEFIRFSLSHKPFRILAIDADDVLTGCIGIELQEDISRLTAEIGYWIGEPHWGRGIASQAVALMLQHVTEKFPQIVRIYAKVFEYNKASMKVLEHNGFNLESIQKRSAIKNDTIVDEYLWVKLMG